MEILTIKDLSFTYPSCSVPALKDVSFSIQKGEFAVLCGATGSGKTTLLRMLKRELVPLGELSGSVTFAGRELSELDGIASASGIGFVMQRAEQQIVTDKVWHELAFGLENLAVKPDEIARRCAEMASYFGIGDWYDKDVSELSGGQKQLLALAAVMIMDPEVLILDEPTAQLDPITAADFIATLSRLNQDFGLTILMSEHRLENVVPICDRLMVMENGSIISYDSPEKVIPELKSRPELLSGMPAASRLYAELECGKSCPLTVRQGRSFIESSYNNSVRKLPENEYIHSDEPALEFRDVYFRYEKNSKDILDGLSLKIYRGELFFILGGNGSGKTTALSAAAGLLRPYSGSVRVFGKKLRDYKNRSLYRECLTLLPQDVQTVFLKSTVRSELEECGADLSELPFDISQLLDKHPYDLSGGEQQIVALAKVLATKPRLLLLDEPTKGMDAGAKKKMSEILFKLKENGITVAAVTHDIEFAAEYADRCAMFFGGKIVSAGTPHSFFPKNSFYTTAISRMTRGFFDNAVTVGDAAELCRLSGKKEAGA